MNKQNTTSGNKNILFEAGKYTCAAFEYTTLLTWSAVKGGGAGVIHIMGMGMMKEAIAKLNPQPLLSTVSKKLFQGNGEKIKESLEQRIALIEERLQRLEEQRAYLSVDVVSSWKNELEKDKMEVLRQLVEINKELHRSTKRKR